jgi:predicted transporter
MTSISLNQSESEKRLHRILWCVKFIRAAILNLILISLAIGLYMAFGITGLYPLANYQVDYLRTHQADSYSKAMFWISSYLLATALFVWLYISITRVKRTSLQVQAIWIFMVCILVIPVTAGPFLFSCNHLDPLFTILYGIYLALFLWWLPICLLAFGK